MIRIACTNCKTILSIDDAFAGGVCRCQHCGTIQTVPAHAKDAATVGASGQSIGGSKSLYQNARAEPTPAGTGLDDLASAIAGSGLSGSALSSGPSSRPGGGSAGVDHKKMMPIFIGIGLLIAVLLGVILWLALRSPNGGSNTSSTDGGTSGGGQSSSGNPGVSAPKAGPNFCNIKLDGTTVIYLLDRGSGTKEMFQALKDAALKSARSLGSEHKFQIVFWNSNGQQVAYPENTTTYASADNIDAAHRAIDDISAFGSTEAKPALERALKQNPDVIVLATGKGWDLDDNWVQEMLAARGSSPVKIDTISLGSNPASPALQALASKTGGTYKEVSNDDLRSFAE